MSTSELRSSFEGRDSSPGFLMWRVTMAWQARQRAALRPHNLTHAQYVLLAGLVDLGQAVSQVELARTVGIDAMMTSQVLRALEARALVVRHRGSVDTRVVNVTATSEGQRLVNAATSDVEATDRTFFQPLDETTFIDELRRLLSGAGPER